MAPGGAVAQGSQGTITPYTEPLRVGSGGSWHILCADWDRHSYTAVWHNICSGAGMFQLGCCGC